MRLYIIHLILLLQLHDTVAQGNKLENNGECGRPFVEPFENSRHYQRVRRIINGINARPHNWPWLASFKLNGNLHHWCMGFLISRNFILTAAHCLTKVNDTSFEVVLGLNELNNYRNAQFIKPKRLIIHEDFQGVERVNDIALIELSRSAKINEYVSLLCLPDLDSMDDNFYKKQLFVSGWGVVSSKDAGKENSLILKQTSLNIVIDSNCSFNESIFCTINQNDESNICHGDSGAPLMLKYHDRWYAYGIASKATFKGHNRIFCNNKAPSKFTNILFFRSWIESKVNIKPITKLENEYENIEYEDIVPLNSKLIIYLI